MKKNKNLKLMVGVGTSLLLSAIIAPTILTTSCSSAPYVWDGVSPNKSSSFTANTYSHTWNNISTSASAGSMQAPADFAKEIMTDVLKMDYSDYKTTIDYSSQKSIYDSMLKNNLIDANVLELMIIMDVYNFIYTYSNKSDYDDSWSKVCNFTWSLNDITNITLNIDSITSHYNKSKGYTYDVDFQISTTDDIETYAFGFFNLGDPDSAAVIGETIMFGTYFGTGISLSCEETSNVISSTGIPSLWKLRFSEEYTFTDYSSKPGESIARFITQDSLNPIFKQTGDNFAPYLYTDDFAKLLYPNSVE